LQFELPQAGWYATDPASRKPLHVIKPPLNAVRLWDGGAYENLGLEPLYKAGKELVDCDFLICSDASQPLVMPPPVMSLRDILKGHLASPRLFDISSDQIRALRSKTFVGAITRGDIQGALILAKHI
jgi:NTE family protein